MQPDGHGLGRGEQRGGQAGEAQHGRREGALPLPEEGELDLSSIAIVRMTTHRTTEAGRTKGGGIELDKGAKPPRRAGPRTGSGGRARELTATPKGRFPRQLGATSPAGMGSSRVVVMTANARQLVLHER